MKKERFIIAAFMIFWALLFVLEPVSSGPLEPVEETLVAEVIEPVEVLIVEPEPPEEPVEVIPEVLYYDVPLTEDLQDHIFEVCEKYSVDAGLVMAMIRKESTFNPDIVGDSGRSFGLMQIQPRWHQERMDKLGVTDLLDPYQNIVVGVDYIAELIGRGKGIEWALMAYNGGPSNANKGIEQVVRYADTVLAYQDELVWV